MWPLRGFRTDASKSERGDGSCPNDDGSVILYDHISGCFLDETRLRLHQSETNKKPQHVGDICKWFLDGALINGQQNPSLFLPCKARRFTHQLSQLDCISSVVTCVQQEVYDWLCAGVCSLLQSITRSSCYTLAERITNPGVLLSRQFEAGAL